MWRYLHLEASSGNRAATRSLFSRFIWLVNTQLGILPTALRHGGVAGDLQIGDQLAGHCIEYHQTRRPAAANEELVRFLVERHRKSARYFSMGHSATTTRFSRFTTAVIFAARAGERSVTRRLPSRAAFRRQMRIGICLMRDDGGRLIVTTGETDYYRRPLF